jgi:PIN domain nuclease of toxin-antitoxin system
VGGIYAQKVKQKGQVSLDRSRSDALYQRGLFWEISLKFALGRLELTHCSPDDLPDIAKQMGLEQLVLDNDLAARFHRLPRLIHKDPFDRMILWQAIEKKLCLISKDSQFDHYKQYGLRASGN